MRHCFLSSIIKKRIILHIFLFSAKFKAKTANDLAVIYNFVVTGEIAQFSI